MVANQRNACNLQKQADIRFRIKYSLVDIRFALIIYLSLKMLAAHNSVISKISVQSKKKSSISKMSPSTHNTQSPHASSNNHQNNFTSCENYWDQSSATKRVTDLQRHIEEMERHELQMEAKFQQCIQSMLAEIERNNDSNARLAAQVNNLKQQLTQSRKDILIIEEYIKTNLNKEVKNRETNDPCKMGQPVTSRNQLISSSSSKNLLLRRTPSKIFRSKLLQRQ